MGIPVPVGAEKFELLLPCPDAGLLEQFPGDGLAAVLPRLGSAAGILPGAGKALALGPPGQQKVTLAVIDPHADHEAIFPGLPPGPPAVDPAGEIAFLVVDVIEFHSVHLLIIVYTVYHSIQKKATAKPPLEPGKQVPFTLCGEIIVYLKRVYFQHPTPKQTYNTLDLWLSA